MAIHQNLKPSDQEIPLLLAGQALSRVDGLVSRPMGAVSVDNVDGSSTLIGGNTDTGTGDSAGAGDVSGGVITQVGKTSLPGAPSGLSVSSVGLTVVLTWDGSFTGSRGGAVRVEAVLTDADGQTINMGSLTGAGSLTAIATAPGMASVACTTYDDAHDQTGVSAPNHSDTVTLDIVLSELVDSQQITDAVDANKKTLEQANKDLAQAKTDIAAAASTAQSAKTEVEAAKTKADKAVSDAASATSAASTAQRNAATALTNANTALQRAKNITVSFNRPSDPATGDIWYPQDYSGRVIGMKTWDGNWWEDVTIMAGSIIVPGSIGSTLIGDGQITTGKLTAGSVTANKLAANSVTADKIVAGSITGDRLAANSVNADKLAANSVTADKLAANSVTADKLAANSVTAESMSADAVTARSLAVGDYTNLLDDSLLEKTSTDNQLDSRWHGTNLSWNRDANVPGGEGNVLVVKIKDKEHIYNPYVSNNQPIPCKGGDTFYAGAYVWYWNDVKSTMKVQLHVKDLDNQKTYWLDAGVGTADIGQWQWVDGAATIPASAGRCAVQIFIFAAGYLNQWTDSDGTLQLGYYMVYNPVLRHGVGSTQIADGAISADKIAAGSITADKIKGNRLVGAQIQTNENAPYMLMTSQKFTVNPEKATTYNSGSIQFIGQNNALMGGLMFGNGDSPNNNMGQRDDYAAYLTVTNPKQSHNSNYANQIEIRDIDDPDGDNRRIDISSRYVSIGVNEGGNKYWRSYDFSKDGLSASYTDASGLFSERTSGYLSAHRTLFHNDNQPSAGVITLNDDITRYWKLEFEFKTTDGVYFGMPVYRPSVGKKFNASTVWYGFNNLPWLKTRAYVFTSSRTVDCVSENNGKYWRTGQQPMGNGWAVTPGDFISVTHVEGFFN